MNRKTILFIVALITSAFMSQGIYADQKKELAPAFRGIKSPGSYGSIVLNKYTGEGQDMKAVVFPHWLHRTKFTCKVCHSDIGFPMKAGTTDIKMEAIFEGRYCGKCHDGNISFDVTNCDRCHSLGVEVKENAKIEVVTKNFPKADFGNKVDWVMALRYGNIKPKASLDGNEEMAVLDTNVDLPVTKFTPHPPDVVYPHKAHTELLACDSCHPSVFNMEAGSSKDMSMIKIISGQYCGICHGKVAFPLEDCFRCHSKTRVQDPSPYAQPEIIPAKTNEPETNK